MKKVLFFLTLVIFPVMVLASPIGDINGDGKVTTIDFIKIRKHILSNPKLDSEELKRADVNSDGSVNVLDYNSLRRIILKIPALVKLNKSNLSLKVGESETLKAEVIPSDATTKDITWISSDTSIVTVDKNGLVTAKKEGIAQVSVKLRNNEIAVCNVKVTAQIVNCNFDLKEGNTEAIANSNIESINKTLECAKTNNINSLVVPRGNYYFNVAKLEDGNKYLIQPILLNFSNFTLDLNNSTFNVYKNGSGSYQLFRVCNTGDVGSVTLKNGTLVGDRKIHTCFQNSMVCDKYGALRCSGGTHESGHAIVIQSVGVNIDNLKISDMMGDGIIINFPYDISKSGSVNIQNSVIENVRRNGISIIQGKNINVKNNTIRYTHGTWPQVGIDIERDRVTMFYENVLIEGNTIYGNTGRRSVQIFPGIKGYLKIINNHLGDQVVGWEDAALDSAKGPKLEKNLIIISGNDTKIPTGERDCVEEANTVMSHVNKKCYDQVLYEEKCKK